MTRALALHYKVSPFLTGVDPLRRHSTTYRVIAFLVALGVFLCVWSEVRAWKYYSAQVPKEFGLGWSFTSIGCHFNIRKTYGAALFELDRSTMVEIEQRGISFLNAARSVGSEEAYGLWRHATTARDLYRDGPPLNLACSSGKWVAQVNEALTQHPGWYSVWSKGRQSQLFVLPSLRTLVVLNY